MALSVSLFVSGLVIELVRNGIWVSQSPIPVALSVWTYSLALLMIFAAIFVAYPTKYAAARTMSVWRYAILAIAALVIVFDFFCSRFWPGQGIADPSADTEIFLLRWGVLLLVLVGVLAPSMSWVFANVDARKKSPAFF